MPAAEAVLTKPEAPQPAIPDVHRFQRPDLDRHGAWVMERLTKSYPHIQPRLIGGWLQGLIFNNEVLFLYQDNAVALARIERGHTLAPHPVVREHFVFAREPAFIEEASHMYTEMAKWARSHGCDTMIVREGLSDVPDEMINARLKKRLFVQEQKFVKIGEKG